MTTTETDIKDTLQQMGQAIEKQQQIVDAKKEDLKFEKKVLADLLERLREFASDPDLPLFDK